MSTKAFSRLPSRQCIVKYSYFIGDRWHYGDHICFAKTDEEAIESTYKSAVWSGHDTFHIVEIKTEIL